MDWRTNAHPISDIRDWSQNKRLEIRPDYQRKAVWSEAAKIMLMDSILRNIPMPKIIFQSRMKDGNTYRSIIDGQQRVTAILSFLNNEFSLTSPYNGPFEDKYFSDLEQDDADSFLSYRIDCNEIVDANEDVIRDMYSRLNKYNIPLNKQELRRADYPGDFLDLAEELSDLKLFEDFSIFTTANRRRMKDTEYISELLVLLIDGIQDKMNSLDDFYHKYQEWDDTDKNNTEQLLHDILQDISTIFNEDLPINKTRFRQKADFYSLVAAIKELRIEFGDINESNLKDLRKDLKFLHDNIEPESDIETLSEYAIKCVSQSNTLGSRRWRTNLLKSFIFSIYTNEQPNEETANFFFSILSEKNEAIICPICHEVIDKYEDEYVLFWNKQSNFLFENSNLAHCTCI